MLDSGSRGCGFEPHGRHSVVSLSKALYPLPSAGSTQEDPPRHGRKESTQTNRQNVDWNVAHRLNWVRCTINRSHSTPCKKAEFEHLQIFPGHCLDFFLSVSGKICHSPIKKVKRQPTLIISFSQHSPFFGEQSKNPG